MHNHDANILREELKKTVIVITYKGERGVNYQPPFVTVLFYFNPNKKVWADSAPPHPNRVNPISSAKMGLVAFQWIKRFVVEIIVH